MKSRDLVRIQKELLVALRGRRTQNALSRLMGYTYNQAYRWESGITDLHWPEFIDICEKCQRDVHQLCRELFKYEGDPRDAAAFVGKILGNRKQTEVAAQLDVSRYKVNRWLSGKTTPSLVEVLMVMRAYVPNYLEFLRDVANPHPVPSVDVLLERRQLQQALSSRIPFAGAMRECLKVALSKSTPLSQIPSFVASRLGILESQVEEAMEAFEEAGVIRISTAGTLETRFDHLPHIEDEKGASEVRQYWLRRMADLNGNGAEAFDGSDATCVAFRASQKVFTEVQERYQAFYTDLCRFLEEKKHEEQNEDQEVYVFSQALFDPKVPAGIDGEPRYGFTSPTTAVKSGGAVSPRPAVH